MPVRFSAMLLVVLVVLSPCAPVAAHQPRLVVEHTAGELITIEEPEVSQAFYGELDGAPEQYLLRAQQPIDFHLEVLVPSIQGIETNVSATIFSSADGEKQDVLVNLGAQGEQWTVFEEPVLRDTYFRGPTYDDFLSRGEYIIEVRSPDNFGKYVLVVGRLERYPPGELWHTFLLLPELNAFFERPLPFAYLNVFGLAALGIAVSALALLAIAVFLWRWRRRRRAEAEEIRHPYYFG